MHQEGDRRQSTRPHPAQPPARNAGIILACCWVQSVACITLSAQSHIFCITSHFLHAHMHAHTVTTARPLLQRYTHTTHSFHHIFCQVDQLHANRTAHGMSHIRQDRPMATTSSCSHRIVIKLHYNPPPQGTRSSLNKTTACPISHASRQLTATA